MTDKYKILSQKIIPLKGPISQYGMNQNGLLYASIYEQTDKRYEGPWLHGISIEKGILWRQPNSLSRPYTLRIDPTSGKAFICEKNTITRINQEGKTEKVISISLAEDQQIGSFVILDDGFVVSLQGKGKPNTIVLRIDFNGATLWRTAIEVKAIAYKGLVQMRSENNWEVEQSPPFKPRNWVVLGNNELLVANTNVLATFHDMPKTGVGKSYCLDLQTGKLKWETKTATMQSIAAFKDGSFLIGHTGYGAFDTKLYTPNGHIIDQWETAGKYLISSKQAITAVEMFSYADEGDNYVSLKGDGEVITHQSVNGHFVIYPVLDEYGNCVFWRKGELILIDGQKEKHILMTKVENKRAYNSSRILLYEQGILIFSLDAELFVLETNLGRLDKGDWTCKYGNLEGNPVF